MKVLKKHCERKQKEGCGFRFEPTNIDGYAKCLNTLSGNRQTDNFIKETLNEQEIAKDD